MNYRTFSKWFEFIELNSSRCSMAVVLGVGVVVVCYYCIWYHLNRCQSPFLSGLIHKKLSISYQIYILICQSMHLFSFMIRFKCFLCANWNCHPLCGSSLRVYRYGLLMRHWFRQINTQKPNDANDNWFMPTLYRIAF